MPILKVAAVTILLAECLARGGAALLGVVRSGARMTSAAILAGITILGLLVWGLALTGLLYPATAGLAAVCMAVAGRGGRRVRIAGAIGGFAAAAGPLAVAVVAAAAVAGAGLAIAPVMEQDAWIYHLGAGWQFLQAHRVLTDQVPVYLHLPLLNEMAFVVPTLTGDDRAVTGLIAVSFVASVALFLSLCRRAWVGVPLALLAGPLTWMASGKSDIPAAAALVAGCLLWEAGARRAGALLMGMGVAGKPGYAPVAACWVAAFPPAPRRLPGLALAGVVPFVPWAAGAFLAIGNPFFPAATSWIPTLGWQNANVQKFSDYAAELWIPATGSWRGVPGSWLRHAPEAGLVAFLAIPGLIVFGRSRRATIALAISQLVTLGLVRLTRYMMPSVWLVSLLAARELAGIGAPAGRFVRVLAAGWAAVAILAHPAWRAVRIRDALMPEAALIARDAPVWDDACRRIAAARPGRLLAVGVPMVHRIPARVIYGGVVGETPVVWSAVRTSSIPAGVARKLRQTGSRFLLYNPVSAQVQDRESGWWFPWDFRMTGLWEGFCRTRLRVEWRSGVWDYRSGGFIFYRIASAPERPAAALDHLPGAEAIVTQATGWLAGKEYARAAGSLARTVREHPEVLAYRCYLGFALAGLSRWRQSYDQFRIAVDGGLRDPLVPDFGIALFRVGRLDEARRFLKECLPRYPCQEEVIRIELANVCLAKARGFAGAGREAEAAAMAKEALAAVEPGPWAVTPAAEPAVAALRESAAALLRGYGSR